MADEDAARDELLEARHRVAGADRGDGDAQRCRALDDLVDGVPSRPAMDHRVHVPDPADALVPARERVVGDEVVPLDQDQEVAPLLRGDRAEPDPAVSRRLDRRDLDGARERARMPGEALPHHRVRRHRERHHLEEREIDVRPARAPARGVVRGEGRDGRIRAAEPLAEPPARRDRRPIRRPARGRRAAPRLQRELRRRPPAPRTAAAEG
jgi:hypothetical protein